MPSPSRTGPGAGRMTWTRGAGARLRAWGLCAFLMVTAGAAGADGSDPVPVPTLPSGLDAGLHEMFLDIKPDGQMTYARFRFVAPEVAGEDAPDFEARVRDLEFLCNTFALPRVEATPEPVDRIVISLADRAIPFGQSDPDVTQFFEVFSIRDDICIWEEF
ncbi:MAG: hypothetical protein HLUCCO07_11620 [Rhodobacteraceae bacterium HLUCCO07]|nr:MAG: hypothetical protein HLUCCO07_11620 [Rhodobacteraceae bacterium HLUCCO07]